MSKYDIDNIYNAIAYAETGSFSNPWIRTTASKTGSSAYGPVQMTGSLLDENLPRYDASDPYVGGKSMIKFSPEEELFLDKYGNQASDFLFFGNDPTRKKSINPKTGSSYSENLDYTNKLLMGGTSGGEGYSWSDDEKLIYESVAKKMMTYKLNKFDGNIDKFIEDWRGKSEADDLEYYEKVRSVLNKKKDNGGLDTIKAENKIFNLFEEKPLF